MCTGVRLTAANGDVVYGRTMEWNSFDIRSILSIIPREHEFIGVTPEGMNGLRWKTKYGVFGFDIFEKDYITDGMFLYL